MRMRNLAIWMVVMWAGVAGAQFGPVTEDVGVTNRIWTNIVNTTSLGATVNLRYASDLAIGIRLRGDTDATNGTFGFFSSFSADGTNFSSEKGWPIVVSTKGTNWITLTTNWSVGSYIAWKATALSNSDNAGQITNLQVLVTPKSPRDLR